MWNKYDDPLPPNNMYNKIRSGARTPVKKDILKYRWDRNQINLKNDCGKKQIVLVRLPCSFLLQLVRPVFLLPPSITNKHREPFACAHKVLTGVVLKDITDTIIKHTYIRPTALLLDAWAVAKRVWSVLCDVPPISRLLDNPFYTKYGKWLRATFQFSEGKTLT